MRGYGIILGAVALAACVLDRSPVAPSLAISASNENSSGPATPPFNDEIILRDATGAGGFGHVKFRQPKDGDVIIYLDTWVRDLAPNASRSEERRVGKEC